MSNIKPALQRYKDARLAWIKASNAMRDRSSTTVGSTTTLSATYGCLFNDISGGVGLTPIQTGTPLANITSTACDTGPTPQILIDTYNNAFTELKAARKAYDGGVTGLLSDAGNLQYQTVCVPSTMGTMGSSMGSAYVYEYGFAPSTAPVRQIFTITGPGNNQVNQPTTGTTYISTDKTNIPTSILSFDDYEYIGQAILYNKKSTTTESTRNKTATDTVNYTYYSTSALYDYVEKGIGGTANAQVVYTTGSEDENYSLETIRIPEISIQKWVNIVVSFGDNTVDTYINGKLVDSHVSTGTVQHVSTEADDTTMTWGGFTGYISSSRYYPTFLTPQEAWSIYSGGFSDNLMGNFLNQYNAKFTFTQNQVEKASFYII
jgi:hypothetical protein